MKLTKPEQEIIQIVLNGVFAGIQIDPIEEKNGDLIVTFPPKYIKQLRQALKEK